MSSKKDQSDYAVILVDEFPRFRKEFLYFFFFLYGIAISFSLGLMPANSGLVQDIYSAAVFEGRVKDLERSTCMSPSSFSRSVLASSFFALSVFITFSVRYIFLFEEIKNRKLKSYFMSVFLFIFVVLNLYGYYAVPIFSSFGNPKRFFLFMCYPIQSIIGPSLSYATGLLAFQVVFGWVRFVRNNPT